MFQLFLFDVIVVLCLLMWITRSTHKVDCIPGPRVYPIIGNLPDLIQIRRKGALNYLQERRDRYGSIFRLSFLGKNFIFISEPDYIKTILSSSENLHRPIFATFFQKWTGKGLGLLTGALWHKHRKLLEPVFSNLKIKLLIPGIAGRCEKMCNELRRFEGQEIDAIPLMRNLCAELVCDQYLNKSEDEVQHKEIADANAEILYFVLQRMLRPWLWKDSFYSLTRNAYREGLLGKKLQGITREAISSRKKQSNEKSESENRNSFLDYLIECQKRDPSFSDEDIRSHIDTFISGVMNPLPLAMAIVLYFLGSYDSVQDNVRRELNSVLPQPISSERIPTLEELSQLKYLESVINESLRFGKPPSTVGRYISKETILGKYTVPAGSTVVVDWNPLHRDKKYYSSPDEFNPKHFEPEAAERRPLYAFVPFGKSIRSCIAERYCRMCFKLVVGSIIQNFRVKSSQSLDELMESQLRGVMQPGNSSHSIFIKLESL